MAEIKALTLTQPWASLVALGHKRIETRSWKTDYRGPLVIHAAKGHPFRLGERVQIGEWEVERDQSGLLLRGPIAWPYRLPLGCVVARVHLFNVRRTDSPECVPDDKERALGDYTPGRFAWYLNNLHVLTPTQARGSLGLWTWDTTEYDRRAEALNARATRAS
jgi:hypothetical protein